jgi:hypothetical protein
MMPHVEKSVKLLENDILKMAYRNLAIKKILSKLGWLQIELTRVNELWIDIQ